MENFLILGKSGVGKSSLINSIFGITVAPINTDTACTKVVELYGYHADYGDICLFDTPGLAEENNELDYQYLNLIKEAIKFKEIHHYIYVTPLYDTRFRPSEKTTIKLLSEVLGTNIWNSCWIIFTFSASIESEHFDFVTVQKIKIFSDYIEELTTGNFNGFKRIYFLDNVVSNWHKKALPVNTIFNH